MKKLFPFMILVFTLLGCKKMEPTGEPCARTILGCMSVVCAEAIGGWVCECQPNDHGMAKCPVDGGPGRMWARTDTEAR